MVGSGRCYWMKWKERAGLERRVGSLGFHNYNNFIFAAETHFYREIPISWMLHSVTCIATTG